jgi:hypothetical protein
LALAGIGIGEPATLGLRSAASATGRDQAVRGEAGAGTIAASAKLV